MSGLDAGFGCRKSCAGAISVSRYREIDTWLFVAVDDAVQVRFERICYTGHDVTTNRFKCVMVRMFGIDVYMLVIISIY